MYIHILVLAVILFIIFCIIWKNELIKNLFFTVCFIITLWLNGPCFVNMPNLENTNNIFVLPYKLFAELGILYTILANMLLGIILFFQSKFTTSKEKYSYKEIKKIYDNFGNDATELYIIGKDLDFLFRPKFDKQTKRILHLKNKCKLLCEFTEDKDLLDLYKKVSDAGVEIKYYTHEDNITNLKGQIKIDQNGNKKAIFTTRAGKKYQLLNMENQFLVSALLDRCNKTYQEIDLNKQVGVAKMGM